MGWSRGVLWIEIGDVLLCAFFRLDDSGAGPDRVGVFSAQHRKGDSAVRPGIPLSYGLSPGAVPERHPSAETHPDSIPNRRAGTLDMGSGSLSGLAADFAFVAIES